MLFARSFLEEAKKKKKYWDKFCLRLCALIFKNTFIVLQNKLDCRLENEYDENDMLVYITDLSSQTRKNKHVDPNQVQKWGK